MNKFTKLLSVFIIAGAVGTGIAGVAGCKENKPNTPGGSHNHEDHLVWVPTEDGSQHYQKCTEDDYATDPEDHDFSDGDCICGVQHTHTYTKQDGNNGYHINTCSCGKTAGSYKFHNWNDETGKCTDCGADKNVEAVFELNVSDKFEVETSDDARTSGIFTVGAKTQVRQKTPQAVYENKKGGQKIADVPEYTKSVCINTTESKLIINAPAPGKLVIHAANGSSPSSATGMKTLSFTRPNGGGTIEICADDGSPCREVEVELSSAGQYTIGRTGGTIDIYYLSFTCTVENTPAKEIQVVAEGTNEYFAGQTFAPEGLAVNKITESGYAAPLDIEDKSVIIDSSAVDTTKSGIYPVKIKYNDGAKEFETSYNVTVYAVESMILGKDAVVKEATNTSAGNGVYANHHLRELYFVGSDFSTDGLTVKIQASFGTGAAKKEQVFTLKKGYTITGNNLSTSGKKTVTVTLDGTSVTETFDIYVMAAVDLSAAETVNVKVDKGVTDAQVGSVVSGEYQFKTIHQALEFLENCKAPTSAKKTIKLGAGTFTEKLEVNVPNLTIEGVGTDTAGAYTMIEWDSLYGVKDDGGFEHTTDSTATLNIREKAVGFTMKNVVVSNWFNSAEHFIERYGDKAKDGVDHRALAMLVQADKVTVEGCTLLGYQDTLELFTGRHVFKDSLIVGVTDFIFGTNGTTYFKGCEIRSIKHLKNDDSSPQVGYITAFKGENKGATTDAVKYGAIFDGCDFTAEEGVVKGWAIGRAWGKSAAVMVMNSTIGDHIATGTSRYVSMGNGNPQDAQFTEYNNTGAGAVATPVKVDNKNLWNIPAQADAVKYADFATIFGKTNGKVTYSTTWDGTNGATITEKTYEFTADTTGNIGKKSTDENGDSLFNDEMTIIATGSKQYWTELGSGKNFLWLTDGCVIKINVVGEVTVTTYNQSPYGLPENISINYVNGKAIITIKATEKETIPNGCCIKVISVDTSVTPEHVHQYGAWTVEEADKPTSTSEGTARRTCTVCEDATPNVDTKVLPVLSTDNYDIAAGSVAGKSVYTLKPDEPISFEADSLAGLHVHNYGPWVYDADNSKITKTCDQDGCDAITVEVEVPALTDAGYTITDNTASLEAAGTGTYTIEIEGETYVFTAPTPQIVLETISASKEFAANVGGLTDKELYFKGITIHNTDYWLFGTGSQIKFNVNAGATIVFYCNFWGGGIDVSGCGGTLTEVDSSHKSYTAIESGMITVDLPAGATSGGYLRTISVTYEPKEITERLEYVYAGDPSSTEEIVLSGAQDHNGGAYLRVTGSIQLKVKAGSVITIVTEYDQGAKLQEGDGEAVNMTLATEGNRNTSTYTATADGIVTITPVQSQLYVKSITVELPVE